MNPLTSTFEINVLSSTFAKTAQSSGLKTVVICVSWANATEITTRRVTSKNNIIIILWPYTSFGWINYLLGSNKQFAIWLLLNLMIIEVPGNRMIQAWCGHDAWSSGFILHSPVTDNTIILRLVANNSITAEIAILSTLCTIKNLKIHDPRVASGWILRTSIPVILYR